MFEIILLNQGFYSRHQRPESKTHTFRPGDPEYVSVCNDGLRSVFKLPAYSPSGALAVDRVKFRFTRRRTVGFVQAKLNAYGRAVVAYDKLGRDFVDVCLMEDARDYATRHFGLSSQTVIYVGCEYEVNGKWIKAQRNTR